MICWPNLRASNLYLAEFFINIYAERYKKRIDGISPEVMQRWLSYQWPGNIRELQNVIHQAVLLCKGTRIEVDTILNYKDKKAADEPKVLKEAAEGIELASPSRTENFRPEQYTSLKDLSKAAAAFFEHMRIESALANAHGNKSSAARALGITRKTLLGKLRRYGIC